MLWHKLRRNPYIRVQMTRKRRTLSISFLGRNMTYSEQARYPDALTDLTGVGTIKEN